MGKKKFSFLELPNEEDIIGMRKEIGMSDASIKEDLQILKKWLEQQPHLPSDEDDGRLERFLFYCKNSLERSKQKLEQYYSLKSAAPEVFLNRNVLDPRIEEQSKIMFYNPLPKLTEDNNRVLLLKLLPGAQMADLDVEVWMRRTFMVCDLRLATDLSAMDIFLDDLSGFDSSFLRYASPTILSKIFTYGNLAYPYRIKHVILYKPPKILEAFINICKGLVSKKLASKVVVAMSNEELHKYVSKSCLPKEYGGDETRSLDEIRDAVNMDLVRNKDFFEAEEKQKSDESKRIGKSSVSDISDMQGSFRKISFD